MSDESNTENQSAENAPAPLPVEETPAGNKRGRKPAEHSLKVFEANIVNWRRSGGANDVLPASYSVAPMVKRENGYVQTFEVVSTPPVLQLGTDNHIRIVRFETDGGFEYKAQTVLVSEYEYTGNSKNPFRALPKK